MSALTARLPMITALLFAVAMVASLAWQGYRFWEQEQTLHDQATTTQPVRPSPQQRQQPQVALDSIDLFGRADPEALASGQDTENLPETNLRLFLRGVLAGTEEQPGSALVEDDRGRTEVYIIGDELPGNARLRSVHANRIIIERSGKLENLYFPETDDSRGMELAAIDNRGQPNDQADAGGANTASGQSRRAMATPQATDERRQQIRQRLEELRQRLKDQ